MTLQWIGETWLPRLLAAGLQSLFLVAAIALLVRWLRPSAAVRCWLWWCAALQLLVGALWPAPLELPLLPAGWRDGAGAVAAPAAAQLSPAAQMPYLVTRADLAAAPVQAGATAEALHWLSWPALFAALWLAGAIVLAAASVRAYLAVRRRVAAADDCEHGPALRAYRALGASLGLRRLPPLRVSAQIDSPQLVGPPATVLLPQRQLDELSDDELAMALHHELTHLRRRDLWWGWVPALARHLFFFHPLVHVIAREYAIAREQACDAAVLDSRRYAAHDYGRLLLRLGVAQPAATGVAGASPTYRVLKRRLTMLKNKTSCAGAESARMSAARLGGVALAVAVAALGLVPYKVTAATEAAAREAGGESKVTVNDHSRRGEQRITEIGDGDARTWSIKDGQYYRVHDDGRYEPVRDAATRARLEGMQRDAAQARVDAAKAARQADQALRDAAAAGREAERAKRQAQAEGERARREAEQARRDADQARRTAERDAERARREAEHAGEQAQRAAVQAQREGEQARREADQRQRDRDQARLDSQQGRRDLEQRQRDLQQRARDLEQARRDRAQSARDARQQALDSAQSRRDLDQAMRDVQQAHRDIGQALREGRIGAADSARLRAAAEQAQRAVQDLDVEAIRRQAQAAARAAGPAVRDSEAIRREALRAAGEAMREVRRALADADA